MSFCRITWSTDTVNTTADGTTISSNVNVLEFDIVERWQQTSAADATDYTVEQGVALTDHKRALPKEIIIDGLVSNTPFDVPKPGGRGAFYRIRHDNLGSDTGITVREFTEDFNRVQDCYDALQELVRSPILCTVEIPQKTFENVLCIRVEDSRDNNSGGFKGTRFRVVFKEIFTAETQTVRIPVPREPRGRQKPIDTTASTQTEGAEPPRSWALSLGQTVTGG
jgi:hypothetical protein